MVQRCPALSTQAPTTLARAQPVPPHAAAVLSLRSRMIRASRDPEPLVSGIAVATGRHAYAKQDGEPEPDGVVLIGAASHRHDHAIDELVPTLAVLLGSKVVGVGRPPGKVQQRL